LLDIVDNDGHWLLYEGKQRAKLIKTLCLSNHLPAGPVIFYETNVFLGSLSPIKGLLSLLLPEVFSKQIITDYENKN
jgi:hypothetical protein